MHPNRSIEEIKNIPMFFIVGSPRSGTTMLQQMLDANPNLIIPLESPWIVVLKKQFFKIKKWDKALLDQFVTELYKERKFLELWKVDRDVLTKELAALPIEKIDFQVLIKVIYLNYPSIFEKKRFTLIGDKNPVYSIYVDFLIEIFPEAKFIHIVRDYRPNILSNRRWFLKQRISVLASQWVYYNKFIEIQKCQYPHLFYTIKYEDLVKSPEIYARQIADFLNFEYVDTMLDFHKKTQEVYLGNDNYEKHAKSLKGLHENLVKPISSERVESWKQEMKTFEIEIADFIAGDFASKYGYHKMFDKTGFKMIRNKMFGYLAIALEVNIVRFYHKYLGQNGRKLLRIISIAAYKLLGIRHMFNPELRDELKMKKRSKG